MLRRSAFWVVITGMSEIDRDPAAPDPKERKLAAFGAPTRTEAILPGGEGAVPDASELPAGAVLGPFRVVTLLGRGGMGVVYEAEEIDSGRRVALKVLSPGLRREIDRARFLKEGRLAASLDHPNCVYVFGAWELDGRLVIAMELMRETLADRLKHGGRLPSALAVDAILQVIAGLDAAATAGILHRDVKPSNCFVDEQGRVKIGDFGISISAHVSSETGLVTGRHRRDAGICVTRAAPRRRGGYTHGHLRRRRHLVRARHRTPALRQAQSHVAVDGGGQRRAASAPSCRPDDSTRPQPGHSALSGQEAGGPLREPCRAGFGAAELLRIGIAGRVARSVAPWRR